MIELTYLLPPPHPHNRAYTLATGDRAVIYIPLQYCSAPVNRAYRGNPHFPLAVSLIERIVGGKYVMLVPQLSHIESYIIDTPPDRLFIIDPSFLGSH